MDKLSNLPDPILCHILSFLPTKTSIACGALSKRWQLLWTCVPVLDLDVERDMSRVWYDDDHEEHETDEKEMASRFLKIVDKFCSLPREFQVKKLRLSIRIRINRPRDTKNQIDRPRDTKNHLHKWISACEELDLAGNELFTFPKSFHHSNTVVLKLSESKLVPVESGHFPKLRVLHLSRVSFVDKHGRSLQNFLSAFPILEELSCENLLTHEDTSFMISVPTLTSLVLRNEGCYRNRYSSKFVLETPALEYLSFKHDIASEDSLVIASLCNLRKADITCLVSGNYEPYVPFVTKLLKDLSGVKLLKLSLPLTGSNRWFNPWNSLFYGSGNSYMREHPVFNDLVRFELCIPSRDCVLLLHIIQKFHNLRHMGIDKVLDIEETEVRWREPRQVPICLSSTVSSFCFQGFEGFKVEVELVKYVRTHAKVLKSMTIKTSAYYKASEARIEATRELPMVLSGDETLTLYIE